LIKSGKFTLVIAIVGTILLSLGSVGCWQSPGFDDRLERIAEPYRFSIVRWSLGKIVRGDEPLAESKGWRPGDPAATSLVLEYFSLVSHIRYQQAQVNLLSGEEEQEAQALLEEARQRKQALRDTVESIIGRQIRETLNTLDVFNPLSRYVPLPVGFPPIDFELDELPHVLVISPRERIETMREVVLVQALDRETMERIEAEVDALGVSSLVVGLGGFGGTYPTFVADDITLHWTIPTAVEEWLHQYLAFTPLGFAYVLDQIGVARNYDIAALNETLAGIASDEIGDMVLETYYPGYAAQLREARAQVPEPTAGEFDFSGEMRQIRVVVDELLVEGRVEQAEQFMEERRQYLASQGYYIRKLNQAYFAFHGSYTYAPTSVDPLGEQMRELRARTPSLKAYLNVASVMTSREQLLDYLKRPAVVRSSPSASEIGCQREVVVRSSTKARARLHQWIDTLVPARCNVYQAGKAPGIE
jgi:hypothetical protein